MKIFVDMDGVLTDLDGALSVFGGISLEVLRDNPNVREKLIRDRVSKLGLRHWENLSPLNKTQWEKDLRTLKARGHEIEILTSYGTWSPLEIGPLSHQGKCNWLKTHYGPLFNEGVITGFNGVEKCSHKELFSKSGTCLIDDSPQNCAEFNRNSGVAFLYTQQSHFETLSQILGG